MSSSPARHAGAAADADRIAERAPLLRAVGVTRVYGRWANEFRALRGVDLDIRAGESLAIVGKSGSGKSTLMHLLALLDRPTEGRIEIDGQDAAGLGAREVNALRNRRFGFVFQQFFLTAGQSVVENVSLPLVIAGVPPKERQRRTMEALESVGLADKARNRANDLSGGQKQRVVIARALVNEPAVIFADEPTGNLDTTTGGQVEQMLFDLQAQRGITVVVVTHDHELSSRCDRAVTIADGLLEGGDARAAADRSASDTGTSAGRSASDVSGPTDGSTGR